MIERLPVERPVTHYKERDNCVLDCDINDMADALPAPQSSAPTFQEAVSDLALTRYGLTSVEADELAEQVDDLAAEYFRASSLADSSTAGALVAARLENTPLAKTVAGRAYIRVLQGNGKPSLSTDAEALGVSKEAVRKAEAVTRAVLFG
jgi:hypothetical protein